MLGFASGVGFLYGVVLWGFSRGFRSYRPPPQSRWEGVALLAFGLAALLVFPLALWLRTRAWPALALLLAGSVLALTCLALSAWGAATCVPRYCDPAQSYNPLSPIGEWFR